jgi:hypothetical protein
MNALQLNEFEALKTSGRVRAPRIGQLSIGTMPAGQGSAIATVNDTPDDAVVGQAVPFVEGGYPQHLAPPETPGVQHQSVLPSAQVAPWISVPACALGSHGRPKPTHQPAIGLHPSSGSQLNLPSKPKGAPKLFTAA